MRKKFHLFLMQVVLMVVFILVPSYTRVYALQEYDDDDFAELTMVEDETENVADIKTLEERRISLMRSNSKKKEVIISIDNMEALESNDTEIIIRTDHDTYVINKNCKSDFKVYLATDDHYISFFDQLGNEYRAFNDREAMKIDLYLDDEGLFDMDHPIATLESSYILYDCKQGPVSAFVGKNGWSKAYILDENDNLVADRIIHPESELKQNMKGYFGLEDLETKIKLFNACKYRFHYLEEVESLHYSTNRLNEALLKMHPDKQVLDMSEDNVIAMQLLPKINYKLTLFDHEEDPVANQELRFYHDPELLEPILNDDGYPVSYTTNEKGEIRIIGTYDGECKPILQKNGRPRYELPHEINSDTIYIFTVNKEVYVKAPNLPDDLALRDDSTSFILKSADPQEFGGHEGKYADFFPAVEGEGCLYLEKVEIPEVPVTADNYNPMPWIRLFTFGVIGLIYSYVSLKLYHEKNVNI